MKTHLLFKVKSFFSCYPLKQLSKGMVFIQANQSPEAVFYLKRGYVKQYAVCPEGRECAVNIFKPGSFFPMLCALGQVKNRYYYKTLSQVELYEAPKAAAVAFVKQNPDVLTNLTQRLMSGLDGVLKLTEQIMHNDSYRKLVFFLILLAERFGKQINNKVLIDVQLTHQDIAAFIGAIRGTVTTQIKKLRQNRLIEYNNRKILIKSLPLLKAEIQK